jgi:hypothetical protein
VLLAVVVVCEPEADPLVAGVNRLWHFSFAALNFAFVATLFGNTDPALVLGFGIAA